MASGQLASLSAYCKRWLEEKDPARLGILYFLCHITTFLLHNEFLPVLSKHNNVELAIKSVKNITYTSAPGVGIFFLSVMEKTEIVDRFPSLHELLVNFDKSCRLL